ncbi:hypothetical protein QBC35DRAFT_33097 [Podospora australis]|uniref:Uncharacterized protein n=1 Tax=Podospora australis TaxID=1536484 RepID=A0AAN7AFR1_9PEZI|nr:hypothetical protein QBC35DRAFT_33097 [Podospora australis]
MLLLIGDQILSGRGEKSRQTGQPHNRVSSSEGLQDSECIYRFQHSGLPERQELPGPLTHGHGNGHTDARGMQWHDVTIGFAYAVRELQERMVHTCMNGDFSTTGEDDIDGTDEGSPFDQEGYKVRPVCTAKRILHSAQRELVDHLEILEVQIGRVYGSWRMAHRAQCRSEEAPYQPLHKVQETSKRTYFWGTTSHQQQAEGSLHTEEQANRGRPNLQNVASH